MRPLELDNVYNQGQVSSLSISLNGEHTVCLYAHLQINIVLREGEALEIPDFDDIYDSDQVRHTYHCVMV